MEVKPGYKQTEVGVIPEDWEVTSLGNCLSVRPDYGINAPAVPYSDKLPVYIRITDITEDGRFSPEKLVSVKAAESSNYYLSEGDIVFARTGASVGKSYRYDPKDGQLVFAGFLIRVRPDARKLLPAFAAAYVTTGNYWNWVHLMSMRSGQPGINSNEYAQLPIPRPGVEEQCAIAGVLGDVDALLGALEKLIVKKRDLKQAAMQQLLTGKTRLPGFHGEWVVKTIFDLAGGKKDLFDDGDWIEAEFLSEDGVRLVQTGNIGEGVFVEKEEKKFVSEATFQKLRCKEIREGDVLICRLAEPAGRACILPKLDSYKAITAVDVTIFRPLPACADSRYLVQLFSTGKWFQTVNERCGGSTRTRISRSELGKIGIAIPPLPEQTAIAALLSDMDAEIEALEQRLAKPRALKQGMMQELLTGRVRLI